MKIVDYERDTACLPYLALRWLGAAAAVFSLIVCLLIIANHISLQRLDPVHSPALEQLLERLRSSPQDEALKEEIRELDLLARRAFFSSQHFNRTAVLLLLGGLAVMIISFKALRAYQPALPLPDPSEPRENPVENARWARRSLGAAGLFLVGFALMVSLPWRSPLDETEIEPGKPPEPLGVRASAGSGNVAALPTQSYPPWEERLRQWAVFLGDAGARAPDVAAPRDWDVDSGRGVAWKTEVPLPGFNSPIVWGDRVFLSGANEQVREVYCYDAASGRLLWTADPGRIPDSPVGTLRVTEDTGYAAATLATDGVGVYAIFANGDFAAFDLEGDRLWACNLGRPDNPYGHASSLAAHEGRVWVQMDQASNGFVAAFDAGTGEELWRTARSHGPSSASPRWIPGGTGGQLVLAAEPSVVAYDPADGHELWRVECLEGGEVAPSPVYADGVLFVAADYIQLTAYDVEKRVVLWHQDDVIPDLGTPLVANGGIFFGSGNSGIYCLDAATGDLLWEADTDEAIYASPVLVGEAIHLFDRGGTCHIFRADTGSFDLLGTPSLHEEVVSTPAVTEAGFFVRGVNHLYQLQ